MTNMAQDAATGLTDVDISAIGHSIACVLRSGRVSQQQAQVLQGALGGLQYCSVGVYVKEFGTVITTDSLLTPGFFDLSLCPTKSSMAGCVVLRATAFHDNVSVHRNGVPVDIARAVQRYSISSAVCVPVRLTAVISDGDVIASERLLGTLTLASCLRDAVTPQHRSTAERVAAALAPSFADATSSMYNDITDYVLGPMHGHPYPAAQKPRPLPSAFQPSKDSCWPDDSDSEDDDPGTSQLLPVTEAESASDSASSEPPSAWGSLRINMESLSPQIAASTRPSITISQQQQQEPRDATPRARHEQTQPQLDRPSGQRGGASDPSADRQHKPHHDAAGTRRSSALSTAQRRAIDTLAELKRQFSQDDSLRSSFTFTLPLSWMKPKRSRSDDSAHESNGPDAKSCKTEGSAKDSPDFEGKAQQPVQAIKHGSCKQHGFLLNFCDAAVERQFCMWHAQQRTKVQLWYSMVVISVMLSVRFVTPTSQHGPVLWLPPLLQLLPAVAMLFTPTWYLERSEALHVMLNVMKAVWCVWVGTPHPASFWTPDHRLAVLWKVGLDTLMVSGLGELVRPCPADHA
ncbi:hypothetical protein ABBQ32_005020 [Trebouxia sp. C0010 RCD-2024]